jgi:hypothetical protein
MRIFRWIVIILTVGGGTEGLHAALMAFFKQQTHDMGFLCVWSSVLVLYCFTIVAGLIFIDSPKRTWPLVITFLLQVLALSSPVLAYQFIAGGRVVIGFVLVSASNWHFVSDAVFGSYYEFTWDDEVSWHDPQHPWGIGINLLPIVMLFLLAKYRRKSNKSPEPTPVGAGSSAFAVHGF